MGHVGQAVAAALGLRVRAAAVQRALDLVIGGRVCDRQAYEGVRYAVCKVQQPSHPGTVCSSLQLPASQPTANSLTAKGDGRGAVLLHKSLQRLLLDASGASSLRIVRRWVQL